MGQPLRGVVSTGLTSAHIPDGELCVLEETESLNGPDFGPYSGQYPKRRSAF